MLKKILVVLTGGTIGSRVENGIINVTERSPYLLIDAYQQKYNKEDLFEVQQPMNLLSENMNPINWTTLCAFLSSICFENYQGVIVTHGSDTLSYTAALVGMLYRHVSVPLVLVASNYALGEVGSNGLDNFKNAVDFIRLGQKGAFVVYQNDKGENQVFLTTRIVEAEPYGDQFSAFGGEPYGVMKEGNLIKSKKSYQPLLSELNENKEKITECPMIFHNHILVIRPYPGLDYTMYNLEDKPAAVLHYMYHSTTACTEAGIYSMLSFVKRCKDAGIAFYIASAKETDGVVYATADEIKQAQVKILTNISLEAAYARLMILFQLDEAKRVTFEKENFYFESLPKPQRI